MKNVIRFVSIVGLLTGMAATSNAAGTPPAPAAKGAFQRDLLGVYGDAEKKVLQLEDAVPQSKFNWRPAPGVRSIAEAYLHIAFGNYGLTKMASGKEPPADAEWEMNPTKWDKKTTDKAEIKKILEKSFAHVHEVLGALPDADLDKTVSFFGHDMSVRAVLIILAGHVNEHLGQEVAYARANKIVPPWSKDEKMPTEKKGAAVEKGTTSEKKMVAEKKP
jgi:uncharacterized damage-inducible protein DinB